MEKGRQERGPWPGISIRVAAWRQASLVLNAPEEICSGVTSIGLQVAANKQKITKYTDNGSHNIWYSISEDNGGGKIQLSPPFNRQARRQYLTTAHTRVSETSNKYT